MTKKDTPAEDQPEVASASEASRKMMLEQGWAGVFVVGVTYSKTQPSHVRVACSDWDERAAPGLGEQLLVLNSLLDAANGLIQRLLRTRKDLLQSIDATALRISLEENYGEQGGENDASTESEGA